MSKMTTKKNVATKHFIQPSTMEFKKLEKTHKSELRMISTAALKFKAKYLKVEDPRRRQGETEATNVRMYESHFPGFCYQKDGKYRKRVVNCPNAKNGNSTESSEKIKALLFTDNEVDIEKVLCLHLLGTHVHSRRHIQRKDGKLCRFIKSQLYGNRRFTLQSVSQRTYSEDREITSPYDKMLPRYVLDICDMDRRPSNLSIRSFETDGGSEEDLSKWKKFQVPIYINSDVSAIVNSVLEALETVNSPKLKELINLARNPDELRNFLSQEYIQEYLIELAGKQLINNATAYDFPMTYMVFEKNPATMGTVAQVLDIASNSGLRNMLNVIRKNLSRRYEELVLCNVIPGKKKSSRKSAGKGNMLYNFSRTSFLSGVPSTRAFTSSLTTNSHQTFVSGALGSEHRLNKVQPNSSEKLIDESCQVEIIRETKSKKNSIPSLFRKPSFKETGSVTLRNSFQYSSSEGTNSFSNFTDGSITEITTHESITKGKNDSRVPQMGRYTEVETSKYDLKSLNNSQRILLGLKVAGMKSRPVNMHQFENKKKVDVGNIITSIVHVLVSEYNKSNLTGDNVSGQEQRKSKVPINRIGSCEVQGLRNLTRETLSNFRHAIATTENKKRVKEFMSTQL